MRDIFLCHIIRYAPRSINERMYRHHNQKPISQFEQSADFSKNAKNIFLTPLKSPLEEWGVFFKQLKYRTRRLLSAQKIPTGFEQPSDFFRNRKIFFLNPSKSPFRRIEGLFKEANWWGHCYLQSHWFIFPKTTLCRYSKRWFFLCTQYFLVHCPFWTAKEVEGFFIWPIEIFKFRFSTRPANG